MSPISEVHLRLAHLESVSGTQLTALRGLLNPEEKERAARFHFEVDRDNYIACRGLLRRLLSGFLNVSASTLTIEYGNHGKPSIDCGTDGRRLRFNLSHSAGWAVFAFVWDRDVGIDLESAARLGPNENHLSALATRILSDREFHVWRSISDIAARQNAFLRAWTRKEALAKAIGTGIHEELRSLELALDAASPKPSSFIRLPFVADRSNAWLVHDLSAPNGFAAALALEDD